MYFNNSIISQFSVIDNDTSYNEGLKKTVTSISKYVPEKSQLNIRLDLEPSSAEDINIQFNSDLFILGI